ncbi:MAG: hypothetical protein ACR2M3_09870 [Thermomicrobiales bacterium]
MFADSATRLFFRDLYYKVNGPLNSAPVLITLCLVFLAALIIIRTRKR